MNLSSKIRKSIKRSSLWFTALLVLSGTLPAFAAAHSDNAGWNGNSLSLPSGQPKSVRQLTMDKKSGKPRFILGELSEPLRSDENVLDYISSNKRSFTLSKPLAAFSLVKKNTDAQNHTHYLYQQTYQGIPVYGKYAYAHLDGERKLYAWSNTSDESLNSAVLNVKPGLGAEQVIERYRQHLEQKTGHPVHEGGRFFGSELPQPTAELLIYAEGAKPLLAYSVQFETADPERASWTAFLDASSGEVILEYNRIQPALDRSQARNGTGIGHQNATRPLHIYLGQNNRYYLADVTRNMQNEGIIDTWDFAHPSEPVSSPTTSFSDPDAVDAHYFTGIVYDYYRNVLGRDSVDGSGKTISSVVHYQEKGKSVANAFWDEELGLFFYGDGDEKSACMTCELDIVAHEFTHGVTQYTSNLDYYGQSGALNESFSDIMAAVIDQNWTLGEDTGTIFRSMSDPNAHGQPKHMDQYVNTWEDNRGVHYNSGIPSYAAYRLAVKLEALGYNKWDTLGRLAYNALLHLTPSSDFYAARDAFVAAAATLGYGPSVSQAVTEAWAEVGIAGSIYADPIAADSYESNNSIEQADNKDITGFGSIDGTIHLDDIDFYKFTLSVTDYVYADLSGFNGQMFGVLVDLADPANSQDDEITFSYESNGSEIFKKQLDAGKPYYLIVDAKGKSFDSKGAYNLFFAPSTEKSWFENNLTAKIQKAQKLLSDYPYVSENGRTALNNAVQTSVTQSVYAITSEQLFDLTTQLEGAIKTFTESTDKAVPSWQAGKALTASSITQTGVKLSWTSATDDKGVTGYRLYQDGKLLATRLGNEYEVGNLIAGTTYTFTLQAGDAAGNWTTDGPAVTVTTSNPVFGGGGGFPGGGFIGGGLLPNEAEADPELVKEEDLKAPVNGTVTLKPADGKNEIKLPANAAELLGDSKLQVQAGDIKAVIKPALLKQLSGLISPDSAKDAVINLQFEKAAVEPPASGSHTAWKAAGNVFDLHVSITTKDGTSKTLGQFSEPVEVTFSFYGMGLNEQLLGVYTYNETAGSWEYVGGVTDKDRKEITVKLSHFSKYAVLEYNKTFADVPELHWGNQAIRILAAKHIVNGISDDLYDPEGRTTRAEFAALLTRTLGLTSSGSAPFEDISPSDWYAQAVAAAYQAKIIDGVSPSRFAPSDRITREEMAVMIVRAFEYKTGRKISTDPAAFTDGGLISEWARPYVYATANQGLMNGTGSGIFDPREQTTRAQCAQVIYNLLQRLK